MTPLETGDWTPRELADYCEAGLDRERRQARFLYAHVEMMCSGLQGKLGPVWDYFSLWTDEEIKAARIEQIKAAMLRKSKTPMEGRENQ